MRGQGFSSLEDAVEAFKNHVMKVYQSEWKKCFDKWFERMKIYRAALVVRIFWKTLKKRPKQLILSAMDACNPIIFGEQSKIIIWKTCGSNRTELKAIQHWPIKLFCRRNVKDMPFRY